METKINNFNGFDVRCVTQDDVVWFVAKDVVGAVGIIVSGGINKYVGAVPDKWKGGKQISTIKENILGSRVNTELVLPSTIFLISP